MRLFKVSKNPINSNSNYLINNRVSAFKFGLFFHHTKEFVSNSQILYSRNYGNFNSSFDKTQISIKQSFIFFHKYLEFQLNMSGDVGELWTKGFGLNMSVKKNFR